MGSFESFDIVPYDNYELHKKEKLSSRFFGSKTFKSFVTVFFVSVSVFVCCVMFNDITVRGVDFGNQSFVYPDEQTASDESATRMIEYKSDKININTSTATELMSVPEIGVGRASDIIEYRTENGNFRTAEEIMSVECISETTYCKIKDYITVE